MEKKRILFVNDEMVMGGVSRILCTFLELIDRNKYDIDLLILHKHGDLLKEVPKDINVIEGTNFFKTVDIPLRQCSFLNIVSKIRLLLYMKSKKIKEKIIIERKKMLNKHYDIEFAAKEGFCTIFTAYGDSDKKINWVQTDYKVNNFAIHHMELMKDTLKLIDINIACSRQVEASFKEVFCIDNIVTIHNPINNRKIKILSDEKLNNVIKENKINLITVARFHSQKALHRIINAFAKYKDFYTLTIIGDGILKDELYNLAERLNVFNDINWFGILDNPYNYIKDADLFIMSSLYEGYPTITIESLISGTPVLSTRVAGIDEQICRSEYGFIVDNSDDAIEKKLDELKDKKKFLHELKQLLKNYCYDNDSILNKYYQLF